MGRFALADVGAVWAAEDAAKTTNARKSRSLGMRMIVPTREANRGLCAKEKFTTFKWFRM
jgi:hypothetical protein